jgi:hypothetical protein
MRVLLIGLVVMGLMVTSNAIASANSHGSWGQPVRSVLKAGVEWRQGRRRDRQARWAEAHGSHGSTATTAGWLQAECATCAQEESVSGAVSTP